ncbi:hypothetical protein [Cohnella sp.]|uniref:hypothetical protein n=1 Tax=Cohnella sp. TaxID=1883426 RepID=UPI003569577D
MIKNSIKIAYIGLAVFVSGCGTANMDELQGATQQSEQSQTLQPTQLSPKVSPSPTVIPKGQSFLPDGHLISEEQEGDFVLQIVADKSDYTIDEPVKLKARLKYVGELPEVNISHAASAFSFLITETTHDIGIGYVMNQPLIHTQLKKGEWLEETYTKTGGYGETDPHKEFIMKFLHGEAFPEGAYNIVGQADFTFYQGEPEQPETKEMDIHFSTKPIHIEVK